jgi:hypothetical protein
MQLQSPTDSGIQAGILLPTLALSLPLSVCSLEKTNIGGVCLRDGALFQSPRWAIFGI